MARTKKQKKVAKKVVAKAMRTGTGSGGKRSGAGRKSVETHFAALNDKLNRIAEKLGITDDVAAPAPVVAKPVKITKIKPVAAATAPVAEKPVAAPAPAPEAAPEPVSVGTPIVLTPPPEPEALPPALPPQPSQVDFEAQFNSLPVVPAP